MNPAHWFNCNHSSRICTRKYGHLCQPIFSPFVYGRLCKWECGGDQMAVWGATEERRTESESSLHCNHNSLVFTYQSLKINDLFKINDDK